MILQSAESGIRLEPIQEKLGSAGLSEIKAV